ncbi:MAG TPA: UrcA family protein [Allosphingosinicella sp.]|nr:UrcA family protein [Allosphingosinicella sp.]
MNRMLSAAAALAMTAGAFALAAPASAAPVEDIVSISLEGLDAANPSDAVRIDRRIRTAAQDVCGSKRIQPMDLRERAEACEAAVTADARSAIQLAAAKQSTPFRLALRVR